MIRHSSLRWRLVAWVIGVMLAVSAIVFVVVYEQTGSQLRATVNHDVSGDVAQLTEAVRTMRPTSSEQLLGRLRAYIQAQPFTRSSSLLFAVVPGHGTATNHPELLGSDRPDHGETSRQQTAENERATSIIGGSVRQRTVDVPDVGPVRIQERIVPVAGLRVRVGAGESLLLVRSAQRSVARSFLIAGGIALVLVLLASYLAGASVSRPLRRMARVAARVDDGDLHPRMPVPATASREIGVLAESFNHMLDRLAAAFVRQREFVADASHELRTPLTVIAGQMEVLAAIPDPTEQDIQRVQRLVAAEVARTSRLVDDMLVLARSERDDFLRRGTLDLPTFVSDLWMTTTAGHERRFRLGPLPEATLDADGDRLAQALRNLIDNALAHTSAPDGRIELTAEARPGDRIRFTITDDGPGIPPEQRERIFERFHRTDESRARVAGGAGLGLAIVQAIAEAHGGQVWAADPRGPGARLELEIPGLRQRGRAAAPRDPSASRPQPPGVELQR